MHGVLILTTQRCVQIEILYNYFVNNYASGLFDQRYGRGRSTKETQIKSNLAIICWINFVFSFPLFFLWLPVGENKMMNLKLTWNKNTWRIWS